MGGGPSDRTSGVETAEFDALGAPPSRLVLHLHLHSPDPAHAFRSSCILLAHTSPCLFVEAPRPHLETVDAERPTTTDHACLRLLATA